MSEELLQLHGYQPLYQEDGNRFHGLKGANDLVELKEELGIHLMDC